jgi:hypothetical protein
MKQKQNKTASKDAILKSASQWLAEKQSPFVVAEEFTSFVVRSSVSAPPSGEALAAIFACGFPCVRGDNGERVLWLRPTRSGSADCLRFFPSAAVRKFAAALPKAEAEAT